MIASPEKAFADLIYLASKNLRRIELSDLDLSSIKWNLSLWFSGHDIMTRWILKRFDITFTLDDYVKQLRRVCSIYRITTGKG